MKFLLILGIPAAIIIILIIIANFVPSFNDRRKGETARAIGIPRIKFNPKWIIILVLVGAGFLTTKIHHPVTYQIAADAQDIWPHIGETVKVKICPDRWSGWINIPPGARCMIDTPGDFEYLFWTGERIIVHDKEQPKWLGKIESYSFRLRGTGDATITIQ